MTILMARLFGNFTFHRGTDDPLVLHAGKLQELFCYLVLQRGRALAREVLAGVLWAECTTAQSKKHLRQALWQLQALLSSDMHSEQNRILKTDQESVCLQAGRGLWLDVIAFEKASAATKGTPGSQLDVQQAQDLEEAVHLYRGDLLEGWYQDWCLFERELLQNTYLGMLDKLMCYCEAHQFLQQGLDYGERILRLDRAHERTHQRMLRLLYLSGDRTGALRQYQKCVTALDEELEVKPSHQTLELYHQICADRLASCEADSVVELPQIRGSVPIDDIRKCLRRLQTALSKVQEQLRDEIQAVGEPFPPASAVAPLAKRPANKQMSAQGSNRVSET